MTRFLQIISLMFSFIFVQAVTLFAVATPYQLLKRHDRVSISHAHPHHGKKLFNQQAVTDDQVDSRVFSLASPGLDVQKYWLEMKLDQKQQQFEVTERIDFTLTIPLSEIRFDADPEIVLGGVKTNHQLFNNFERETNSVLMRFKSNLEVGKVHTVYFKFLLPIKENNAFVKSYEENGDLAQTATFTEPLRPRKWIISVDQPSDKVLSEIVAQVPANWKLMSNGILLNESVSATDATFHWQMNHPLSTYLISIATGEYSTYSESWRGIPLYYWYDKKAAPQTVDILKETPQMMDYFAERLIPYPFEKYALATAVGPGGAMEHTTATTMETDLFQSQFFGRIVALHELAHHWFGDTVTCQHWDDLWLNESLATFFEIDYTRTYDGHEKYLDYKEKGTKIDYFNSEKVNGQLGPIVNRLNTPEEKFNSVTYSKGGLVLDMVRNVMGDEAFFAGLKNYLVDKRLYMGNAVTADFLAHLQAATPVKLEPFFNDWIFRGGYPELKVTVGQDMSLKVEQLQKKELGLFHSPIVLHLVMQDNSIVKKTIWVSQESENVNLDTTNMKAISVDPDRLQFSLKAKVPTSHAKTIAANAQFNTYARAEAINQLVDDKAATLEELKEYTKIQSAAVLTASLRGLLVLYPNDQFTKSTLDSVLVSDDLALQNSVVLALLSIEELSPIVTNAETQLIAAFVKTTASVQPEYVTALAELLVKYQFKAAVPAIKEKIIQEENVGSFHYGTLLRAYSRLAGELAIDEFADRLKSEKYNYRGRTAWALGVLPTEKSAEVIGQALLVESKFADWKEYTYFAGTFMVKALLENPSAKAKAYLEQFKASADAPEELKALIP